MGIMADALSGVAAGLVATAAMDALWYRRYRTGGGDASFVDWEFTSDVTSYGADAPAPAQVGKRIADAVGIHLQPASAPMTNNVVHWLTGIGWGKVAGLAARRCRSSRSASGSAPA